MYESQLHKSYNYPKYPKDSEFSSDKGFVNIDIGSQDGTQWTCSNKKDIKILFF